MTRYSTPPTTFIVFPILPEEWTSGYVQCRLEGLPPHKVLSIEHPAAGKSIYCETLAFNNMYGKEYKNRYNLEVNQLGPVVLMPPSYAARLSIKPEGGPHELVLSEPAVKPWGWFRAAVNHPLSSVQISAWLGALSLALGLVSIALAALAIVGL